MLTIAQMEEYNLGRLRPRRDHYEVPANAGSRSGSDGEPSSNSDNEPSSDSDHEPQRPPPRTRLRVPPRAANDAVGITDGRLHIDGVPSDVSASLDRFVKQAPAIIKQARNWMATNPQVGGMVNVQLQLPQLPLNATWTAAHRERVERSWLEDPERERLLAVDGQKDLLTLYKACLRLVHCLPEDIISCRFNLEYDMDQNRVQARGRSVFWSSPFCKKLTALLVHPMWDGSVALLAIAIQYAVIADTRDRSPWDMEAPPGCDRFLRRLLTQKRQQPDASATEIRKELHDSAPVPQADAYGRPIGGPVSLWDLLFQALEDAVEPELPDAEAPPPAPRPGPFLVRRRHLDMVESALNAVSYGGLPRSLPVDFYGHGIGGRRSAKDYPKKSDLRELRSWSILCERERVAYKELLATTNGMVPETQEEEVYATNEAGPAEPTGSRINETPDLRQKRKRARSEDLLPDRAPLSPRPSNALNNDDEAHGADDGAGNGNIDDLFAVWDRYDPRDARFSGVRSLPGSPGLADILPPPLRTSDSAHAGDPVIAAPQPPLRPPATRQEPRAALDQTCSGM